MVVVVGMCCVHGWASEVGMRRCRGRFGQRSARGAGLIHGGDQLGIQIVGALIIIAWSRRCSRSARPACSMPPPIPCALDMRSGVFAASLTSPSPLPWMRHAPCIRCLCLRSAWLHAHETRRCRPCADPTAYAGAGPLRRRRAHGTRQHSFATAPGPPPAHLLAPATDFTDHGGDSLCRFWPALRQ